MPLMIRQVEQFPRRRSAWPGVVAIAALLGWLSLTALGADTDEYLSPRVRDLREALKVPLSGSHRKEEQDLRRKRLSDAIQPEKLRLSDMRQALSLLEWRDEDRDPAV